MSPPGHGRTAYIAGAGIAGLTLALALAKFGFTVVVLERAPSLPEAGAGLQISPNARKVLDSLGLGPAISALSLVPDAVDVYSGKGTSPVVSLILGAEIADRFGAPYAVMHRADLADVLHAACRRFANIDIVFDVAGFEARSTPQGVSIVHRTTGGDSRSGTGFALIGADGVHSRVRIDALNGPAAQFIGDIAWRALVPQAALQGLLPPDRTALFLDHGLHLVAYPLPHRHSVNLALFTPAGRNSDLGASLPAEPRIPGRIASRHRLAATLAAADGRWTPWPLHTVATRIWHAGAIGLIGDAAHAMRPYQAQGAAMAIEDAAVLAPLLAGATEAEAAFALFARRRRARVERVAAVSRSNGTVFHLRQPFAAARDIVMQRAGPTSHLRRLAWLYGYDALAEP